MEPENLLHNAQGEIASPQYERSIEGNLDSKESKVESGLEKGAEQKERAAEAAAAIADSTFPTTLPTPVSVDPDDSSTVVDDSAITNASPLTAADDDLIEKEWVDRAKKIIIETKEDPYSREEAVSRLQKEYQQKRYGRDTGGA